MSADEPTVSRRLVLAWFRRWSGPLRDRLAAARDELCVTVAPRRPSRSRHTTPEKPGGQQSRRASPCSGYCRPTFSW